MDDFSLNNLADSIKARLYERISTPFAGGFILSWLLWNWHFVAALLLGGQTFPERLEYIAKAGFAPDMDSGLVYPLLSALVIVFIYPFPAMVIYWFSELTRSIFQKIKLKAESERPISADVFREVREKFAKERADLEEQLTKRESDVRRHQDRISNLEKEVEEAKKTADQQRERARQSEEALAKIAVQDKDKKQSIAETIFSDDKEQIPSKPQKLTLENEKVWCSFSSPRMGSASRGSAEVSSVVSIMNDTREVISNYVVVITARKVIRGKSIGDTQVYKAGDMGLRVAAGSSAMVLGKKELEVAVISFNIKRDAPSINDLSANGFFEYEVVVNNKVVGGGEWAFDPAPLQKLIIG